MYGIYARWGVTALGFVLFACGILAMISGWDIVQVERGWSLFLGGASLVAGGVVVVALGQVIARLDEIVTIAGRGGHETRVAITQTHQRDSLRRASTPNQPLEELSEPAATARESAPEAASGSESVEIDRYESGDVTYVMYSDGAVDVRTAEGVHRYASLAELRAQAAQQ